MKLTLLLSTLALAACGMSLWRVPPVVHRPEAMPNPPRSPAEISSISLNRHGCLGPCPQYTFTVSADSAARYDGGCFTLLPGVYEAPLDTAAFSGVARLLLASDYFRSDTLLGLMIDQPDAVIYVTLKDGRERTVWYGPRHWELAGRIEDVVRVFPWRNVAPAHLPECAT